jgi:hypothetical protein
MFCTLSTIALWITTGAVLPVAKLPVYAVVPFAAANAAKLLNVCMICWDKVSVVLHHNKKKKRTHRKILLDKLPTLQMLGYAVQPLVYRRDVLIYGGNILFRRHILHNIPNFCF